MKALPAREFAEPHAKMETVGRGKPALWFGAPVPFVGLRLVEDLQAKVAQGSRFRRREYTSTRHLAGAPKP